MGHNHATITNLNTGASISASNRNSGWVVGAGVEWALGGNWSAKLEYDFLKLDDLTFGPGPFRGDTFTASREIRCLKLVSTIGSGRSSAAVTAGPTDSALLGECDPRKLTLERKSPGCPGALFLDSGTVAEASKVVTLRLDPSLTTPRSNLVSRERRRRIDIKRADNQLHPFSSQRARTRLEQRGARSQSGPPTAAVRLSSSWSDVGTPRHQAQSQEALAALQGREADGAQARWIDYNTNRPHSSLNVVPATPGKLDKSTYAHNPLTELIPSVAAPVLTDSTLASAP